MAEVKEKGIGKRKPLLIVCAVLIVILAISNVLFLMQVESLKNQVNSLEADKNSLQSQVSSLEADKSSLESQVNNLQEEKNTLKNQVDSLNSQVNSLNSQIANLTAISNMKMSTVWVNETLIYAPDSFKTWGPFYANYAGLVLLRVQMIPQPGYADISMVEIQVELSSKSYISRQGTLHLAPGTGEYYYTSTALFPVADLTFPVELRITVRNISAYSIQLAVTITYVY
jgi:chaperonin cofactor prefoldin